jgi:tripartite ATP-independent transporter DctM subunit
LALLAGAALFVATGQRISLIVLPQTMFAGLDSFILLAVPLFLLAGNLMSATSLTSRLIDCAAAWMGGLRGGLAHVSVVTNLVMAGMSGSATADAAATASLMVPAMRSAGYSAAFAACLNAAAATLGPIIPPSITMLLYASLANVSVARLFLAGIIPGIVVAAFLMAYASWRGRRDGLASSRPATWGECWRSTLRAMPALVMPVVIIGGIVSGVCTPTEASAIAVFYALVVGLALREINLALLRDVLRETSVATGVVMLMIAAANVLSWLLIIDGVGARIATLFEPLRDSPFLALGLINLILLAAGTVLEPFPVLMLFVPVLLPIVKGLGIDLVHFGVVITLNTTIALITPPVGASMFLVSRIAKISIEQFSREIMPLFFVLLAALCVISLIPAISTFLPRLLMP